MLKLPELPELPRQAIFTSNLLLLKIIFIFKNAHLYQFSILHKIIFQIA
jgi:hypothetical protein